MSGKKPQKPRPKNKCVPAGQNQVQGGIFCKVGMRSFQNQSNHTYKKGNQTETHFRATGKVFPER